MFKCPFCYLHREHLRGDRSGRQVWSLGVHSLGFLCIDLQTVDEVCILLFEIVCFMHVFEAFFHCYHTTNIKARVCQKIVFW